MRTVGPLDDGAPILVGVGASGAGTTGGSILIAGEAADLMASAVEAALADSGAPSMRSAIDRIAVPQGTWSYPDPARLVAGAVGAPRARSHLAELGVSQQTAVSEAMRAIVAGDSEVAVVVGAEARARARRAEREGGTAAESDQTGALPDVVHRRQPEFFDRAELDAGILVPVQQYALIENALRGEEGLDPTAHGRRIASLWARFNEVAQQNPHAAFPEPRSADGIARPAPENRPMSSPYNKWHVSQMTVDQGAALLLCSVGAARRHGVAPERWIFPRVSIDADHAVSLSRRRWLHRWPAMEILGRAAEGRLGRSLAELDIVEVYSCFPSAVRVQQRELGLAPDGTPTITGGMAFAGGPFNNFTYQATAELAPRLRAEPGSLGMVTTVCGLLTKPGLAVWSAEPDGQPALLDDLGKASEQATPTVEVTEAYRGPARVASYTVVHDEEGPSRLVGLCDLPDGRRHVATTDDRARAAEGLHADLLGAELSVDNGAIR